MSRYDKYQPQALPMNRRQVYTQAYKYNFTLIVKVSLLISLFALPLMVWALIGAYTDKAMVAKYLSASIELKLDVYKQLLAFRQIAYLVAVPLIALMSLGLAGGFYVIKKWLWAESFVVWDNFFAGIRQNWKSFIVLYGFVGLLLFAGNYWINVFALNESLQKYSFLVNILFYIFIVFLFAMLMYSSAQVIVYKLKLSSILKNSFLFSNLQLIKTIGIVLISTLPLLCYIIFPMVVVVWASTAILIFIGFGNMVLITSLYCHSVFDKYINTKQYPEIVGKGLYNVENMETKK